MFIITAKLTKGRAVALVGGLFVLIVLIILLVSAARGGLGGGSAQDAAGMLETLSKQDYKNIKSNDDRVAFLASLGWEVTPEPLEIEEVTIPKEFDGVYTEYNEIQKYQGLDLAKFKGKQVKRYTYGVLNYPTGEQDVMANILIYNNKIVGGDVCSSRFEGFMHGFERIDY